MALAVRILKRRARSSALILKETSPGGLNMVVDAELSAEDVYLEALGKNFCIFGKFCNSTLLEVVMKHVLNA